MGKKLLKKGKLKIINLIIGAITEVKKIDVIILNKSLKIKNIHKNHKSNKEK